MCFDLVVIDQKLDSLLVKNILDQSLDEIIKSSQFTIDYVRGCGSLLCELDFAIGVALLCTIGKTFIDESKANICIHFGRIDPLATLFFELLLVIS